MSNTSSAIPCSEVLGLRLSKCGDVMALWSKINLKLALECHLVDLFDDIYLKRLEMFTDSESVYIMTY